MSKKSARKQKRANALPDTPSRKKSNRKNKTKIAIVALLSLCFLGGALAQLGALKTTKISAMFSPAPATPSLPSPTSPSREYIYAGGRLIATEDPLGGSSSLTVPTSLVAATQSSSQVNITWTASTGAVDHYELVRSSNKNGPFTPLSPNPTTTSFTDTTVTSGVAYLYKVCAVDSSGNHSDYSNIDLATAVSFTDDPLVAGTTTVKATHLNELRQAVDAVRATAGLSAATWTDSPFAGVLVKAIHVQELRTNLDQALSAIGLPISSYTDPTLTAGTTQIKKIHIDELRQRVK